MSHFQKSVGIWMDRYFPDSYIHDSDTAVLRFLEEAIELFQAMGGEKSQANELVEAIFDKPDGALLQEIGGCMVTLAAFCNSLDVDAERIGYKELTDNCWPNAEAIVARQLEKPSPAPAADNYTPPYSLE